MFHIDYVAAWHHALWCFYVYSYAAISEWRQTSHRLNYLRSPHRKILQPDVYALIYVRQFYRMTLHDTPHQMTSNSSQLTDDVARSIAWLDEDSAVWTAAWRRDPSKHRRTLPASEAEERRQRGLQHRSITDSPKRKLLLVLILVARILYLKTS